VPSRLAAEEAVAAGLVTVGGAPAERASRLVSPDESLRLVPPPDTYVSRGGHKLAAALDGFGVDPAGRAALDAGASTGGFTDCLLQRGAARVFALDVGRGQLHERLRRDPRVVCLERMNVRYLSRAHLGGAAVSLVVADLSFISLASVARVLAGEVAAPSADLVLLVKPQFEASRAEASRAKGVIRDPGLWRKALERVASAFAACGAAKMGEMVSPVSGAEGNTEFFLHLRAHTQPS